MNNDVIMEMWRKDSEINPNELGEESNKTPQLHAKYLKILSEERTEYRKEKQRLKKLQLDKYEYYSGRMSTDKLQQRQWKPFPHKILKNDIDKYIEGDDDIISQRMRISFIEEKVEVLESIIDQINKRTFVIKNSIEWLRFTNGTI